MRREVATAQKVCPAATAVASSPSGRLICQSLLAAQLSNGLYSSILGASLLDGLAYNTPCSMVRMKATGDYKYASQCWVVQQHAGKVLVQQAGVQHTPQKMLS